MAVFEEVKLNWRGKDYVIPPDNVLLALAKIEDTLTLGELATCMSKGRLPLAKLATAYGALLRHAGAVVTDDDVYNGMFESGGREMQRRAFTAALTLHRLMVPPEHLRAEGKAAAAPGRAGLSRKPTSSPSAKAG